MERIKSLLVLIAAVTFAASPFFVQSFAGYDPSLFPVPQIDPPVQPAGWAFSIWGVIYLWLIASAAFGLFARAMDEGWDRPRWPLFGALALGTFWLGTANASAIWATVMIFAMLALALGACARAPAREPWLLSAPLGLFAGWLTAASFASLGITAAGYGLLMGETAWAIACITGALVVGLTVLLTIRPHPTYALALAWALAAIAVKDWSTHTDVALLAALGALATLAATLSARLRTRSGERPAR
ncbi:hypothetical protein [Vannielia litorea]|uniref:TspO and MBR related proteins n=1 Tax=Vannielia litorea TaxID=1217970 RepID=A0A1N6FHL1_9RHOB|nr:hypothetical protein [Vannielia litorea]SIN94745.1 hypothetical protein SAMN05444002_1677 [Vannielia litorea]